MLSAVWSSRISLGKPQPLASGGVDPTAAVALARCFEPIPNSHWSARPFAGSKFPTDSSDPREGLGRQVRGKVGVGRWRS